MPTESLEATKAIRKPGVRACSKLERQDRIMLAARQAFAELGYEAATLRQIAATAGLGLGTLFNYIDDKRDLIYLIFNGEMDVLTDRALAAPRPWQSFSEKILSITEPHYRMFAGEPVLSRILLSEILLQTPGMHLGRYQRIRDRLIRGIETLVAEAQKSGEVCSQETPEMIARHIFFSLSGALRWWLASSVQPEWRAGQREFARILGMQMDGLAAPAAESALRRPSNGGRGRSSASGVSA